MRRFAFLLILLPLSAMGDDRSGNFDYYLLALSWTPNWCAREGDTRNDARCAAGAGIGWALHGLWPQDAHGWPEYCTTSHRNPTRGETAAQITLFGSAGLAWHQWNKHGRCSGLSAGDYFDLSRRALETIAVPTAFENVEHRLTVVPEEIARAFRAANPALAPDMLTVTCRGGAIQEVRLCLTHDLMPRRCSADVLARACSSGPKVLEPVR